MTPKVSRLRLLAYARVSAVRGREGPGFISESDQFARCRSYADAYGHQILDEGSDLDVSGGQMSRPTFDRFLGLVADGKADGIIVAKLDRFARSNVGALAAVEAIEEAGGRLISVAEQLDASTGAGRFLRSILFAAAQWERERIGEQWFAARSSAVERGIHVAPYVPAGYKRGPRTNDRATDRRLIPNGKHADTVRQAFAMAAGGATDTEIASFLNDRKLPTVSVKTGERPTFWQSFRVPRLLANRVYLGEARSGAGIANSHAHQPLVDLQTWTAAQHRPQTHNLRAPNRNSKAPPSILSGIVRCAGCSMAMKPQAAGKTSPAIYRCVTTSVHGRCPSPTTITKRRIEDYAIGQFLAALEDVTLIADEDATDAEERRRLIGEAAAAEQSYRAALTNTAMRTKIGDTDHDAMVASLHDAWQEALARVDAIEPRAAGLQLPIGVTLRDLVGQLRTEGNNDELRGLLGEGIEAVFVRPAASRRRNEPVADRVRVVLRGAERLELPHRGRRFEPRPYVW
jgi:DNA invertase Pin-like site-specific DNA recombinase